MYFFLSAHAPSAFFVVSIVIIQRAAPRDAHWRHGKDEHVNDMAQDAAQDVAQDVTQDVLGAAEDGSMKVFIGCPSSSGGTYAQHTRVAPRAALWQHVKDEHVKDAAQDVAEDVPKDVPQDVTTVFFFGAKAEHASSPRHHRRRRLCAARAEMGAQLGSSVAFCRFGGAINWAAQWHLARPVGKRFRGCRAKRLFVHLTLAPVACGPTSHIGTSLVFKPKRHVGMEPKRHVGMARRMTLPGLLAGEALLPGEAPESKAGDHRGREHWNDPRKRRRRQRR